MKHDHMEYFHKSKPGKGEWSKKDKKEFKKMVTEKIRQHNMMEGVYNFVIYAAIASIVGLAIYFAYA